MWTNYFCLWLFPKFLLYDVPTLPVDIVDWKMTQTLRYRHRGLYVHPLFSLKSVILPPPTPSVYFFPFLFSFLHYSHFHFPLSCSLFWLISIAEECKLAPLPGSRLQFSQAWRHLSISFTDSSPTDAVLTKKCKSREDV